MRTLWRVLGLVAATIIGAVLIGALVVYLRSEGQLRKRYEYPSVSLVIPADSAALARGEHLVKAVGTCATCHGTDLGGRVYADMGPVGTVAGPNLTRGEGGIGGLFTDADWIRAIRFGIRKDGTSLIMMPSEVFMNMSDQDLAAVVAYLKQAPSVNREMPRSLFGPVGRALLAAGKLKILTAPKTPAKATVAAVPIARTREYGRYLAEISGCAGCHGYGMSGGQVAGPPGLPPASNLTPTGIGHWTEADLARALREGRRPDGTTIDPFMPWQDAYLHMSDLEIGALWAFVTSLPPTPFGNK